MTTFEEMLEEFKKDPEFAAEREAQAPEHERMCQLVDRQHEKKLAVTEKPLFKLGEMLEYRDKNNRDKYFHGKVVQIDKHVRIECRPKGLILMDKMASS